MFSKRSTVPVLLAALAVPAWGGLSAQEQGQEAPAAAADAITVTGEAPADLTGLTEGPDIEGYISARSGEALQVTGVEGTAEVLVSPATEIKSSGGFLGLSRNKLAADSLLNGLPVTVKTVQWGGGLVASQIKLKNNDLATASMIRNGTAPVTSICDGSPAGASCCAARPPHAGTASAASSKGTVDLLNRVFIILLLPKYSS
jgi:hypothetical protein